MVIIENNRYIELFNGPFEFVNSGYMTGEQNMELDYSRVLSLQEGIVLPMFRLYGWKPWAVSLGANQKETDIDMELCRNAGFDLVRRPTGGRAVLHANEITYCVVTSIRSGFNVHDLYRIIHLILLEALQGIGCMELDFEKSQPNFNEFYQNKTLSVSCFASSARFEIELNNKKLVGSAQHKYNDILLQHGSILIGSGHEQISDVANLNSEQERQILRNYILNHSITIEDILNREVSYDECAESIKNVLFNTKEK